MRFNIYGAPCSAKSTTAAWLFSELKQRQISIELVTEFVKQFAYLKQKIHPFNQVYFCGAQLQSEYLFLTNGIKNIVTDSPVFLSALYAEHYFPDLGIDKSIIQIADKYEESHPSFNIFLERGDKPYDKTGRYQTYDEAIVLDKKMKTFLSGHFSKDKVLFISYKCRDVILNKVLENIDE
ncbi:MAG: AAA family ATPase [Nanoarchaeota archaeon]